MDSAMNNRFDAVSGKLDRVLTRQENHDAKFNDILARLAAIETSTASLSKIHPTKKLGKKPAKVDPRTLKLEKYVKTLAPPPVSVNWSHGITSWGMMLNNTLGDCTIAACGHAVQAWTANASTEKTLPDWVIQDYYSAWDGYVPGDPNTDNGGILIDVLNNWRKYGFGYRTNHMGADLLTAYAAVNLSNQTEIEQAINLFGGLYIGIELPITAQTQTEWTVVGNGKTGNSAPGSWGGHCVQVVGYTSEYITVVTWGSLLNMTWEFWNTYVDEAYALVTPDFVAADGVSPSGLALSAMLTDLTIVTAA
jgi:hypothetical protein